MRHQDRAMSNLESIFWGFNVLLRIYRDIQEPMMDAARSQLGYATFASLVDRAVASTGTTDSTGNAPVNAPMPNPWASIRLHKRHLLLLSLSLLRLLERPQVQIQCCPVLLFSR